MKLIWILILKRNDHEADHEADHQVIDQNESESDLIRLLHLDLQENIKIEENEVWTKLKLEVFMKAKSKA